MNWRFQSTTKVSRNGFADDRWKDARFQWYRKCAAASAKVYFLGHRSTSAPIRLVTTFRTYLQLTPSEPVRCVDHDAGSVKRRPDHSQIEGLLYGALRQLNLVAGAARGLAAREPLPHDLSRRRIWTLNSADSKA
jgi:hypothetical protein